MASAVWALTCATPNPEPRVLRHRARAYELLAGALLALAPAILARGRRSVRALRGRHHREPRALLVLASSWTHLDAIERGIAVTLVTCAFLVAIETADGGVVKRALSHPSIVYLGRISYGTYLWHWIVILVAIRTFHLGSTTTLIVLLVSTALASLSFQLLEHPVRVSTLLDAHRRAVVITGLAVSVVGARRRHPAGRRRERRRLADDPGLDRRVHEDARARLGSARSATSGRSPTATSSPCRSARSCTAAGRTSS